MLLFFVMCGIRPLKILLFSMAAIYIVPYLGNGLMGKPLLALFVIAASRFFHINYLLAQLTLKKGTIPMPVLFLR